VNIQRLASLGSIALMVAAVGCGSSSSDGKGGTTGTGGSGATGTGGTNGTGGTGVQSTDFSLSLSPSALMLPLGGTQTVTVTIDRDVGTTTFTDPLTFELDLPSSITGTGVTAVFSPKTATAASTTLTIDVGTTGIVAGSYSLNVVATAGTGATATQYTVALPLKVTSAAATTLLVDNDFSDNNAHPSDTTITPSPSDTLFATLLTDEGIPFNTFIVPTPGTTPANTPASTDLTGYSTIVWYTGYSYAIPTWTISPAQQAILESWLGLGGKTLLVFSQNLAYDFGADGWQNATETNTFLANYVGAVGDGDDGDLDHATYNVTGAAGTVFAGEVFNVVMDSQIPSSGDTINPAAGTDVLATTVSNPHSELAAPIAAPIAVGRKHVGGTTSTNGTSTVVYVGFPIEDVLKTVNNDSAADFFDATLSYAGL
jgi:hypothetical protein